MGLEHHRATIVEIDAPHHVDPPRPKPDARDPAPQPLSGVVVEEGIHLLRGPRTEDRAFGITGWAQSGAGWLNRQAENPNF